MVDEHAASTKAAAMFNARPRLRIRRGVYVIRIGRVVPVAIGLAFDRGQPDDGDEAVRILGIPAKAWGERHDALPGSIQEARSEATGASGWPVASDHAPSDALDRDCAEGAGVCARVGSVARELDDG